MRAVVFLLGVIVVLSGCSDPPCAEGERKVGSVCLEDGDAGVALSDAGIDAATFGPSVSDDAASDAGAALVPSVRAAPAIPRDRVYICSVPSQCAEWPMPDEQGKAKPSYSVADEVVTDNVTKLVWQRRPPSPSCATDGGLCPMSEAHGYCLNLTLAGRSDWRLPSVIELQSIFSLYHVEASFLAPELLADPPKAKEHLWTGPRTDTHKGSLVRLSDGRASDTPDQLGAARCVAGGEHRKDSRYTIGSDGETVADNWTTLTWRRQQEPGLFSFEAAKAQCANLGEGWRVPTAKELLTLVSPSENGQMCIDRSVFPPPTYASLWSDTAQQVTQRDGTPFLYHLMVTMNVSDELRCGQVVQEISLRSPKVSVRCVR